MFIFYRINIQATMDSLIVSLFAILKSIWKLSKANTNSKITSKAWVPKYIMTRKSSLICLQANHPLCVDKEFIPNVLTRKSSLICLQAYHSLCVNKKVISYLFTRELTLWCVEKEIYNYVLTSKSSLMCLQGKPVFNVLV